MNKTLDRMLSALGLRASAHSASPRDPVVADWWGMSAMSAAGFSVTAETAMREAAVFSCVRVLSEAVASLPLILYRRLPDGGKERATKHPMFSIVGRRPNGWQTRFEWIESSMAHLCLRGAAYSRIVGNPAGGVQLMPMHPDRVRAVLSDSGRITYEYQPVGGNKVVLLQDEVLRVPFMVLDGVTPISVIGAQRESIGVSMAAQDYGARFFANDARPTGGYVTWDAGNRFKDEEEEKKFRENWQRYMVGPNRHKTAFLKPGMKFNELGMNNEDAQFLETRKFLRSEIAGMFRVPPHMIADLDRSTNNNIEHQGIEFVTHTIGPWLARWEQALSRDLLSDADQEDYFFEFLTAGLLRGDSKARADYLKIAISQGGWMSRNEARAIENMNKQDGLDEFLVPLNMTTSEKVGDEPVEGVKNDN
jgi:HK97 family phage portal protein